MWVPADNIEWQKNSACAKPENKKYLDLFFSKNTQDVHNAKNLCFSCPVRKDCLQWALEHRQIWGVWGGLDEMGLRRALSVSASGEEVRKNRYPQCPHCLARPISLTTHIAESPTGGRWSTVRLVECTSCGFTWKSRTSANAVESYHAQLEKKTTKVKKTKKLKEKLKKE